MCNEDDTNHSMQLEFKYGSKSGIINRKSVFETKKQFSNSNALGRFKNDTLTGVLQ